MASLIYQEKNLRGYRTRNMSAKDGISWGKSVALRAFQATKHALRSVPAILALMAISGIAPANATILTFDSGPSNFINSYTEGNYKATFTGGNGIGYHGTASNCSPSCADDGTAYLMTLNSYGGYASTIVINALDNSGFTFNSFFGAENPFANNANGNWAKGISVTGTKANNSTVSQNFILDQINDGIGGVADYQFFASNLSGVFVKLSFTGIANTNGGHDFSIDSLTLNGTSIPEPASLLLLSIGLAGLGFSRRKAA